MTYFEREVVEEHAPEKASVQV
jgi:hypothetical protein